MALKQSAIEGLTIELPVPLPPPEPEPDPPRESPCWPGCPVCADEPTEDDA